MDEPENPAASLKSPAFGGKECFNRVEGYSDGSIAKMAYANRNSDGTFKRHTHAFHQVLERRRPALVFCRQLAFEL